MRLARRPTPRSGWTLLELTVAMAIGLLIVGVGAAVFRIPYQSLARLSGPSSRVDGAFRMLREDLSGVTALPNSKHPALTLAPSSSAPDEALTLNLVCARRDPAGDDRWAFNLFLISHRFEPETRTKNLPLLRWIRQIKKVGEDWPPPREEILAEGITHLNVEAWNGKTWTNRWMDSGDHRLPPALRIELHCGNRTEILVAPIPVGFIAEPEHASPTSRATSGPGGLRTDSRQSGEPPTPGH